MTNWVYQWKPFWIPADDDSLTKAYVEDWVFQIADFSDISFPEVKEILFLRFLRVVVCFFVVSSSVQEHVEAPLPPLQPRFSCERLELFFSCDVFFFQVMMFDLQVDSLLPLF